MRLVKFLLSLALAVLLAACGGGGGDPGTPTNGCGNNCPPSTNTGTPTLSLVLLDAAGAPTTSVGSSGLVSARATLTDSKGNLVTGSLVRFAGDEALIKISPSSDALTDASGVATVYVSAASAQSAGAGELVASAVVAGVGASASKAFQLAPLQVALSNLNVGSAPLVAYGTRPVSVVVTINGAPATNTPVQVAFTASCGSIAPASAVTDATGKASASYTASSSACAGTNVTISASAAGAAPLAATLSVQAPLVTNMQFVSATPQLIYLTGSVGPSRSLVTFKVVDINGSPLVNHAVQLSLVNSGPGITFGTVGNTGALTQTSDSSGLVSVSVFSGTVPTSAVVRAASVSNPAVKADSNVLTVATGVAVQRATSLAVAMLSIDALNVDGQTTTLTFSMADRVGNPVPDGTQVNFVASSGVMIPPTCVVSGGASLCRSSLRAQGTRPANGKVAVMAYVPGEEDFVDANGNNVYDAGESFTDLGNAHMDANFNGVYDTGEFTVPRAGSLACASGSNGRPNTCDGAWGAIDVRRQAMVIFASSSAVITGAFQAAIGGVRNALDFVIADINGNSFPTGSAVVVDAQDRTGDNGDGCYLPSNNDSEGNLNLVISNSLTPATFTVGFVGCRYGDAINIKVTSPTGLVTSRDFAIPNDAIATSAGAATTLSVGQSQSYRIFGGVQPYNVYSSDTSKVSASNFSGDDAFTLTGRATGTATVTVTDTAGATVVIAVTVN